MSGDSPRRPSRGNAIPAVVPPQVVSDRSILDSAIGFINDVTLSHQPHTDSKDTITWARFESAADISDPRHGEDWELEGNVAPPLLLILGYGLGVQVWAIPANGEAVEVLSWRHGVVTALRVLPTPTGASVSSYDDNGRADEHSDAYAEKRPLIAMVDGAAGTTSGGQTQFSSVNFVSLRTGTQVKTIKFKNPVLDILANRSSIVITLHERIAVFDARTLEDRLSITTCYPSPGINPNPVALGPRWLAYAENKLLHSKRSGGGCDGDGVASYTATVLNAAKSFGKGLRELGEQVAAGLTGTSGSAASSKSSSFDSGSGPDAKQPGIITIMDIKNPLKEYGGTPTGSSNNQSGCDPIVAHFIAHLDAVVALEFDISGMLLVTADRRGHDFHIFRIQPHPVGASLAAVHHLYVLHRGDTSAKVQNIAFSLDSRWVAVSTLRGTTHVFPITPYGGAMGVRTHTSLHVVNKLSRFHRSAGLSAEGRSSSPISHSESTTFIQSLQPYHNPTLPTYPRPTVVLPLAQLRQPMALASPPGSAGLSGAGPSGKIGGGSGGGAGSGSQRQRLSSLSDDSGKPLSVCAIFAKSRSWLLEPPNATREAPHRIQRKAVDSLFVMAGHGALIQYDLDTKLASNVAKEKICDDTPIELEVEAKAQWNLGRRKDGSQEIMPPLMLDNWLIKDRNSCMLMDTSRQYDDNDDRGDSWLAQVEIITHAGPHRRLWMGPQFVFKTYNTPSGSNLTHVDAEAVEIGISKANAASAAQAAAANSSAISRLERSSPLNMPLSMASHGHSAVPVLIESGSYSSIEQSPKLMDRFRHEHLNSDYSVAHGDTRLKEDLADAMRESPSSALKDTGRLSSDATSSSDNVPFYDALAEHCDDNDDQVGFEVPPSSSSGSASNRSSSVAALASALPNIFSYDTIGYESTETMKKSPIPGGAPSSIEKVVNPLGTVTTVTACMTADIKTDMLDEVVSQLAAEDCVIHENCDESLFRPVVAIFCDENAEQILSEEELLRQQEQCKPPEVISSKLIVPVIDKAVDDEISKKQEQRKSDAACLRKAMKRATGVQAEQMLIKGKQNVVAKVQERKPEQGIKLVENTAEQPKVIEKKMSFKKDAQRDDFSEEDEVISFKRMTPQKEEKRKEKADKADPIEKFTKKSPQPELKKKEKSPAKEMANKAKEIPKTKEVEEIKVEMLPPEVKPKQKSAGDKKKSPTPERVVTVNPTKSKCSERVIIKMESLNVSNLASSLIEVNDEVKLETSPGVHEITKPPSPLDSIATPKLSKKAKKKQNNSASNSETEEIVEVSKEKLPEIKQKTIEEKEKTTSDEFADLADSLLEQKGSIDEAAMFISCEVKYTEKSKIEKKSKQLEYENLEEATVTLKVTELPEKSKKSIIDTKTTTGQKPKVLVVLKDEFEESKEVLKESLEEKLKDVKNIDAIEDVKKPIAEVKKNKDGDTKTTTETCKKSIEEPKAILVANKNPFGITEKSEKKGVQRKNSIEDVQKTTKIHESVTNKKVDQIFEGTKKSTVESKKSDNDSKPSAKGDSKSIVRDDTKKPKEQSKEPFEELKKWHKESPEESVAETSKWAEELQKPSESYKKSTELLQRKSSEDIDLTHEVLKKPEREVLKNPETEVSKKSEIEVPKKPQSEVWKKSTEVSMKRTDDSQKSPEISKKLIKEVKKSSDILKIAAVDDFKKKSPEGKNTIEQFRKPEETKKAMDDVKISKEESKKPSEVSAKPSAESKSTLDTWKKPINAESKKIEPENFWNKNISLDSKKTNKMEEPVSTDKTQATAKISLTKDSKPLNKNSEMEHATADRNIDVKSKETTKDKKEVPAESKTVKELPKKDNQDIAADKKTTAATAAEVKELKQDIKLEKGSQPKSPKKSPIKLSHDLMPFTTSTKPAPAKNESEFKESPSSPKVITEQPLKSKNSPQLLLLKEDTSPKKVASKEKAVNISPSLPPVTSAWKNLSGAEMISKKLDFAEEKTSAYPTLQQSSKSKVEVVEKLLPDLPSPLKSPEKKKLKEQTGGLKDFPVLKPLDSLPPLPTLEPLEVLSAEPNESKEESLINFESPLLENPALERKITPPPRGFTEQNLIFALCGSLHYVDYEQQQQPEPQKTIDSPTHSVTRSSSAMGEQSTADYKSLTENDEQYVSLEQSSQETNTTNTATTNEKLTSSTNSSACEEIIIVKEKKMTKKQKRKKQQMEIERQKCHSGAASAGSAAGNTTETDVDEELRPLIGMSDSQSDALLPNEDLPCDSVTLLMEDAGFVDKLTLATVNTDSESPMPATTSDDNCFILPAALSQTTNTTPHKVKTKKLEHKINLLAAIEAATSSSTSSAEESGVEANAANRAMDLEVTLIGVASSATQHASAQPLIAATGVVCLGPATPGHSTIQQGGAKKKTKRHYTTLSFCIQSSIRDNKDVVDSKNATNSSDFNSTAGPFKSHQKLQPQKDIIEPNSYDTMNGDDVPAATSGIPLATTNTNPFECDGFSASSVATIRQQSTVINIEPFDDQLSTSSISTNSRLSLDGPSSSSPPISLNGMIDTNLMHFPANGPDSLDDLRCSLPEPASVAGGANGESL